MKKLVVLLVLVGLFSSLAAESDSLYVPDIETFMKIGYAGSPDISDDGRFLLFTTSFPGVSQLYRLNEAGWPYQLTIFDDGIDWYAMSRSGQLAVVGASVGGDENSQLYLVDVVTGNTRKLTNKPKTRFGAVSFSPDNKKIFYYSNQINGRDFHIWSMDIATGEETLIQEKEGYNIPGFVTDDSRYLLNYHLNSNVDNDIYLLDLQSMEERLLTPHEGAHSYDYPNITPDGKSMYFLTNENDDGIMRLAKMKLESGKWAFLDKESLWEYEEAVLSPDGKYLAWVINEEGYGNIKLMDAESGKMLEGPPLSGLISSVSFSATGMLVFEFNSPTLAPDIWKWDIENQKLSQLTFSTYAGVDPGLFREPALIKFKTFDDREIPAFLYLPKNYSGEPIPFIIDAHGGPEGQFRPTFNRHFNYLMLNGFGLLAVNPRGSTGYGQEFMKLDDYKKRLDSVRDYAEAARWLIDNNYTTSKMLGVKGGSYGGYMTMALITEYPDLFAAGCNSVGMTNYVTFLENTADYRRALRESEYGPLSDREFLESISPIHKADQIKAALMIVHGENDPRVPVGEARQIIDVMLAKGTPVDSLIFPDEGHGISKLKNRLTFYRRMVDFFDIHLRKE